MKTYVLTIVHLKEMELKNIISIEFDFLKSVLTIFTYFYCQTVRLRLLNIKTSDVVKVARYESDSFYKIVKNTKLNHVS